MRSANFAVLLCLAFATPGFAQQSHEGHTMPTMESKGDAGLASAAFTAANAKMHKDMDIAFTGKADVDFVRSMIAHHQGAIDMANVELKYGKDPAMKKLSRGIIRAQMTEIATMKAWLAKNEK